MSYPDGTVPTDQTVHPTPIYETLAMGLGAWLLWQLRDRFRTGVLFAIYLVYAGAERFLVEFLRRNDDVALGLTGAAAREPGDDGRRRRLDLRREAPSRYPLRVATAAAAAAAGRLNPAHLRLREERRGRDA